MKKLVWLLFVLVLIRALPAMADPLCLPGDLQEIGAEAFMNGASITGVVLPDSLEVIGARAFSGCTGLTVVDIPGSLQEIGAQAFDPQVVIRCDSWSPAAATRRLPAGPAA